MWPVVYDIVAGLGEVADNHALKFEACMVAADMDSHG